ncbi:hypothetical protein HPB47_017694 [Ixodes persulcatus]|uniref:Uncharacterized protein n=1 Tax=Ixodes persulcatus TaxID=34615 RepID=A0AC60QMN5_IXOPE|nr:hypothetical protein HPB47_017694 [Ixodes persulcatus]
MAGTPKCSVCSKALLRDGRMMMSAFCSSSFHIGKTCSGIVEAVISFMPVIKWLAVGTAKGGQHGTHGGSPVLTSLRVRGSSEEVPSYSRVETGDRRSGHP